MTQAEETQVLSELIAICKKHNVRICGDGQSGELRVGPYQDPKCVLNDWMGDEINPDGVVE